jgi:predicted DNA-binding protein with PD1-like motif
VKHTPLTGANLGRSFALVFDMGDDVLAEFQQFCETAHIYTARVQGIGGFGRAQLGYYDMEAQRYEPIDVDEQVEVISLAGNVTLYESKPRIHLHCIVSHRGGHCTAGHLLGGIVRPTLELFVDDLPVRLHRVDRPDAGIPLIDISHA